jgi:glycosyltransferase involved in cell wall biosynthesis
MQPIAEMPLVSVVIPTRNRPHLVCRAVRCALEQTYPNVEVIVVIDGPDTATERALQSLEESRVRVLALEEHVGGSEARNLGARAAKGEWVALLDDDDEWMPEKIEQQMLLAATLEDRNAFIACRFYNEALGKGATSPSRLPRAGEPISEYFYWPEGVRGGEGFLQTSTLLIPRELLLRVPMLKELRRGQELSWMLRVCACNDVRYYVVDEVLAAFTADDAAAGTRVSSRPKWRSYYEWMQANKECFTPRAYTFCVAAGVIPDAICAGEGPGTLLRLALEGVRDGRPTCKSLVKLGYTLFVPQSLRSKAARLLQAARPDGHISSIPS